MKLQNVRLNRPSTRRCAAEGGLAFRDFFEFRGARLLEELVFRTRICAHVRHRSVARKLGDPAFQVASSGQQIDLGVVGRQDQLMQGVGGVAPGRVMVPVTVVAVEPTLLVVLAVVLGLVRRLAVMVTELAL